MATEVHHVFGIVETTDEIRKRIPIDLTKSGEVERIEENLLLLFVEVIRTKVTSATCRERVDRDQGCE